MTKAATAAKFLLALAFVGASGWFLYTEAAPLLVPPCSVPIQYEVGSIDPRFGISTSTLEADLAKAAAVWNTVAGKTIVEAAKGTGGIPVNLVYSTHQQAAELGQTIDAQQAAYDAQKVQVQSLKDQFDDAKASYQKEQAAYNARSTAYNAEVNSWNAKGGAPPAEFARLKQEGQELEQDRKALNADADDVNALADKINDAVRQLNALARQINAKVSTYNKTAGEDFDQGNYQEDSSGKRINIYEYTGQGDLSRVLAHELGHALGMEHVENPDSIMYSYNIGTGLTPTAEDIAELQAVCKLNK